MRASLSIRPDELEEMAHHEEFEAPARDRLALYSAKLFDESDACLARGIERDPQGLGRWEIWLPSFTRVRGDHAEYVRLTKVLNDAPISQRCWASS